MPLTNSMRAPLFAELDVSEINTQLKEYIDFYIQEKFDKFKEKFSELEKKTESDIAQCEGKISKLSEQLVNKNQKIALMAKGATVSSSIIRFSPVPYHFGISTSSVNDFKSTGKFKCQVKGLYMISTNIISSKSGSWFKIMKDNEELARIYIADHSGNKWHSGTGIALVQLLPGNTVYIQVGGTINISGLENTFVIFKI